MKKFLKIFSFVAFVITYIVAIAVGFTCAIKELINTNSMNILLAMLLVIFLISLLLYAMIEIDLN